MSEQQERKPRGWVLSSPPRGQAKPPGPCAMVIFGAGGDLTKRLLVPALYNLACGNLIPEDFAVTGVDLRDQDASEWRESLLDMLRNFVRDKSSEAHIEEINKEAWERLASRMSYVQGDLTKPDLYERLQEHLDQVARDQQTGGNVLFYLAIADRFFATVIDHLGKASLASEDAGWRRVVIEKPFGHDLPSARDLNKRVLSVLKEEQVYRIDHFLGKETVQNIMAFRFANGLFEPIWNRDRIDHVQITVAETVGIERRGKFYEKTGALRDMVPNHVFQLVAMVAMDPPAGFDADAIHRKKADLFCGMESIQPEDAVRGQYGPGVVLGEHVRGYREEPDVAADSNIETYVALRLHIDNWRWAGVPIYLRTGKHMARRSTEIAIRFKQAPFAPFEATPMEQLPPNWLVLRIQPEEGISLQFEVKRPGPVVELAPVLMDFRYRDWFPPEPNVGYETLIYDCIIGDQTLFQRADQVEAAWRIVQPVLDAWGSQIAADFPNYESGSDGPAAADALIARDGGRSWRPVTPPRQEAEK
ncbi:MAG: glucose-6-phosphate dehydrogenase [Acetobacteraceae bacterium]|nr:glucose-6-phosphate dehydrogenase [Acetobacteraceae bacterium]